MSDTDTFTRAEIMEASDNDPLWPKPEKTPPRRTPNAAVKSAASASNRPTGQAPGGRR